MKIQFYRNIGMPFDGRDYVGGIGGLETQAIGLGRELAKRGHDVTFYVNCNNPGVYDGVVYKKVSEYKDEADIVIGISMVPPIGKAKRASWTHTPDTECHSHELDVVICNSPWTLENYQKNKPADNYIAIPNGFSYERYAIPQLPKRLNSLILAGSILKGFKEVPAIFKRVKSIIPSVTLDVYGGASLWGWLDEKYKDVYSAMTKAGINFHGVVDRGELINAYQTSEVYFSPRCDYTETFGLAVVESMAAGCVPICSKIGNQTNLLTEVSGVLLEHDENIDEAAVIVELLQNSEKLNKLSMGARDEVKKYDWPNVVNLWENKVLI